MEKVECYIAKKIADLMSGLYRIQRFEAFWENLNNAYNLALTAIIAYGIRVGELPEKLPLPIAPSLAIEDKERDHERIRKRMWVISRVLGELSELCARPD